MHKGATEELSQHFARSLGKKRKKIENGENYFAKEIIGKPSFDITE